MQRRIVLIHGHPDPSPERFCRALGTAYAAAAQAAGHQLRELDIATLALPPLQSREEWQSATSSDAIESAQGDIEWADHIVLIYPLWLGDVPAALKAFLEQVLRPGFAFEQAGDGTVGKPRLHGRSARLIVTMGMPGLFYRIYFRAHSLKSLRRNILNFCGIRPVRSSIIGMVESSARRRHAWLARISELGKRGA